MIVMEFLTLVQLAMFQQILEFCAKIVIRVKMAQPVKTELIMQTEVMEWVNQLVCVFQDILVLLVL